MVVHADLQIATKPDREVDTISESEKEKHLNMKYFAFSYFVLTIWKSI